MGLSWAQLQTLPNVAVAAGLIPGIQYVSRYGLAPAADATLNDQDVIDGGVGGVYAGFPASAVETVTVVSTSANDAAGGTGLRGLGLYGLDGSLNQQYEAIALNGLTPVTSTKTWSRIHKCVGTGAGSGQWNAGVVSVKHSTTTADVFATIRIGSARSAASAFTVPAGKIAAITTYRGSVSNSTGAIQRVRMSLISRPPGSGVWLENRSIWLANQAGASQVNLDGAAMFTAGTDIILRLEGGTATAAGLDVTGSYDVFLFDAN